MRGYNPANGKGLSAPRARRRDVEEIADARGIFKVRDVPGEDDRVVGDIGDYYLVRGTRGNLGKGEGGSESEERGRRD